MEWREYIAEFERICEENNVEVPEEIKNLFMAMAHELGSCQAALDSDDQLNK